MVTQFRGGTEAAWLASPVVPLDRQMVMARRSDGTVRVKFGDGVHTFAELEDLYDASSGGSGGSAAVVFVQALPLATWVIPHELGRFPLVQLYVAGILVETDVEATSSQIVLTFPSPTAGTVILI